MTPMSGYARLCAALACTTILGGTAWAQTTPPASTPAPDVRSDTQIEDIVVTF